MLPCKETDVVPCSWKCSIPTAIVTALFLMWGTLTTYLKYRMRRLDFANIRRLNFAETKEKRERKERSERKARGARTAALR